MSTIIDKKNKIFGDIAAARTLTSGLPTLKTTSSLPSINNGGNSISFLTDLIKSLIGFEALLTTIVDILTYSLNEAEREVKIALKQELKSIVSCGVDPSLPSFIKSTGAGIIIEVNKVDFLDLFKINPNSIGGALSYNNITTNLFNSSDFNTFLYATIQDDGNMHTWKGILDVTFNSIGTGTTPNNTFTIKANSAYNNKTLTDLNNNFIDSLTLFNPQGMVNKTVDYIFGSVSVSLNKTRKQLETEAQINTVVDSIVNADENDNIDDSYFSFTNDEIYIQQQQADSRKQGIIKLECCGKVASSIPVSFLTNFNADMSTSTSTLQDKSIISNHLTLMANQNAVNSTNPSDQYSIKLNFIQQIIDNLIKSIVSVVLSPKVIMMFIVNYKIIYGSSATFTSPMDFMNKNKVLMHTIIKKISSVIIKLLLSIALKKIAELVASANAVKAKEKAKNHLAQILSLEGVPQQVLRIIQGLS